MLKPPALKQGDTIAIVSPSSPIMPELQPQLQAGIKRLQDLGFNVKFGIHALGQYFYNSATAQERADDFNACWRDPDVAMILMSQGGQTANGLLDKLDYELFSRQPKILAGISDGTTLLNAIASRSGIVTFHGPDLLWTFGRTMTEPFIKNFSDVLCNGWYGQLPSTTLHIVREAPSDNGASGPLWGGHSNILKDTMFAGYGPDLAGAILFLEGTHPVAELDRHFQAFRLAGTFEAISGLALGHFDGSSTEHARSVEDMVLEVTDGYNFPIVQLDELGHNVENFVFPIGVHANIDTSENRFSFGEASVS